MASGRDAVCSRCHAHAGRRQTHGRPTERPRNGGAPLTGQDTTYHGGISVAPVHLTKGLEFDGVIISGVSEDNYRRQSLDAKLLYVACTRAMHKLCILCAEPPSQLVRGARNTTAAAE
ncbi:ATP-binding domain-containing protein [Alicyclobacillus pomorum]|uniref:ATP-binding domain-containing protein n=1 Tax=Alicyclobacillus pomorum TaxID=204470 RepID=UPI0009FE6AE6